MSLYFFDVVDDGAERTADTIGTKLDSIDLIPAEAVALIAGLAKDR